MEMLERLKRVAASRPEIRLAVVFGSTARGEARPRSDVDLGVLLDPYSPSLRFLKRVSETPWGPRAQQAAPLRR